MYKVVQSTVGEFSHTKKHAHSFGYVHRQFGMGLLIFRACESYQSAQRAPYRVAGDHDMDLCPGVRTGHPWDGRRTSGLDYHNSHLGYRNSLCHTTHDMLISRYTSPCQGRPDSDRPRRGLDRRGRSICRNMGPSNTEDSDHSTCVPAQDEPIAHTFHVRTCTQQLPDVEDPSRSACRHAHLPTASEHLDFLGRRCT